MSASGGPSYCLEFGHSEGTYSGWGAALDLNSSYILMNNLGLDISVGYSHTGYQHKNYLTTVTDGRVVVDSAHYWTDAATSQNLEALVGPRPFVRLGQFVPYLKPAIGLRYRISRIYDDTDIGGKRSDMTSKAPRWLPICSGEIGTQYILKKLILLAGIQCTYDLSMTRVEFNDNVRGFTGSAFIGVGFTL
jgi:hypothetical protein